MTSDELQILISTIQAQANCWLGDEACENIERLVKYTQSLHDRAARHEELLRNGYRMVQLNDHQ
jgi:hypothetical protein